MTRLEGIETRIADLADATRYLAVDPNFDLISAAVKQQRLRFCVSEGGQLEAVAGHAASSRIVFFPAMAQGDHPTFGWQPFRHQGGLGGVDDNRRQAVGGNRCRCGKIRHAEAEQRNQCANTLWQAGDVGQVHGVRCSAQQPDLAGFENGFGLVVDAQLAVDVADVGVDGAQGNPDLIGDFRVGKTAGNQIENLLLPW